MKVGSDSDSDSGSEIIQMVVVVVEEVVVLVLDAGERDNPPVFPTAVSLQSPLYWYLLAIESEKKVDSDSDSETIPMVAMVPVVGVLADRAEAVDCIAEGSLSLPPRS